MKTLHAYCHDLAIARAKENGVGHRATPKLTMQAIDYYITSSVTTGAWPVPDDPRDTYRLCMEYAADIIKELRALAANSSSPITFWTLAARDPADHGGRILDQAGDYIFPLDMLFLCLDRLPLESPKVKGREMDVAWAILVYLLPRVMSRIQIEQGMYYKNRNIDYDWTSK